VSADFFGLNDVVGDYTRGVLIDIQSQLSSNLSQYFRFICLSSQARSVDWELSDENSFDWM
jgi:hypothetical protein